MNAVHFLVAMATVTLSAALILYLVCLAVAALFHFGVLTHRHGEMAYVARASFSCPLIFRFNGGALITRFSTFLNRRYSRVFVM